MFKKKVKNPIHNRPRFYIVKRPFNNLYIMQPFICFSMKSSSRQHGTLIDKSDFDGIRICLKRK